jgi:hypothetical protein
MLALAPGVVVTPALAGQAPRAIVRSIGTIDSAAALAVERSAQNSGLRLTVLRSALRGYRKAVDLGVVKRAVLTVIDYTLPSHERRFWVIDLVSARVLAMELVAHGRASGADMARGFSNHDNSDASSLGTFVTGDRYDGKNGVSLRLHGLDPGLNDHAMERGIVVHGAWYVSEDMIRREGRLGRSDGCPAVSAGAAPRIIDMIEDGSVVFAYYPAAALERSLAHR